MSDATRPQTIDSRNVAQVIADTGPCSDDEFRSALVDRFGVSDEQADILIRNAMMAGRVYKDDDDQYCRTGVWGEPGWESPDDR